MTKIKTKLLFLFSFILFSYVISFAQDGTRLEDLYLKGKWKGNCLMEIVDRVTVSQCELCFFNFDPNNDKILSAGSVEMTFDEDSLTLKINLESVIIPYMRNKDNHSIKFIINDKSFQFRVFLYEDMRILEDEKGMLIALEKLE